MLNDFIILDVFGSFLRPPRSNCFLPFCVALAGWMASCQSFCVNPPVGAILARAYVPAHNLSTILSIHFINFGNLGKINSSTNPPIIKGNAIKINNPAITIASILLLPFFCLGFRFPYCAYIITYIFPLVNTFLKLFYNFFKKYLTREKEKTTIEMVASSSTKKRGQKMKNTRWLTQNLKLTT